MSDRTPPHPPSPPAISAPSDEQGSAGQHDDQRGTDAPAEERPETRTVGDVLRPNKKMTRYGTVRVGDPAILF